ncbi:hypothetical protein J2S10_000440 [Neobacillus ginsengisoli]|uniref:Uncharacterized protein n=1 Tax=Neobacillus ginsengisoli TaxID=904295 RepID=A0ABT9XP61_9BACI|nr:hypothetical protein [Neobacillus ginsengisoli]
MGPALANPQYLHYTTDWQIWIGAANQVMVDVF